MPPHINIPPKPLKQPDTATRWVTRGQKRPERAKIRYFVVFRPDYWSNTPNKWFTESGDVQNTSRVHPKLSNSPTQPPDGFTGARKGQKGPERAKIRYFVVFRPDYWSNTPNKRFTESGDVQNTSIVHPQLSNSPTQPPDGSQGATKAQNGSKQLKTAQNHQFNS